ncbi:MAG: starch-binding protein [Muribaculaceae bacterium]|nr:starch-binding protein [Muribaculaceae bacterium]
MQLYSKWIAAAIMGSCALMPFKSFADSNFNANRTDFRDETIYFAITTRFYDGDPKNNVLCWDGVEHQKANNDPAWRGDFAGLIEKLDYIKALGFTAIWITPIVQNASGYDYHGYHAMDFSKVDLRYESRKEWGCEKDVKFQDLIDAAHEKGIKIILDIVLQHTGNFGENKLCHLFDRDQDIRNQADIESCLIPDQQKLGGSSYWSLPNEGEKTQYSERFKYMKNTGGQNLDTNNYWHHVSTEWNWDFPSRWWGQIAGDCVDLNTENPAVVDYIVECYGKFIEMGVDGFRIDTTGHIAPLTFNAAFIPKFIELGEKYKDKRPGQMPFYMFGECCARFGGVIYRDHHELSSHYYTWKSDPALVEEWKSFSAEWWAQQNVPEGAPILGNMLTCEKDPATVHNSDNVFMKNGAWHEPDYSEASGYNVIDFPMHYNFNNAGQAVNIAKEGDHYYNDASWNVVYVDSHDYCPGPNDGVRFNGGTQQWAENLSLMFTFRGIPCLYYGSEVEFQKGKTIDEGPQLASMNSGRAYYGEYLKGNVTASDFGTYTADGNVAKTLEGDLAHHVRRLNQIRQACPALRKGQYTWDGCSANGGWAFKRAYKDSYALVAINGGATFTNVPAGTYTDLVTGKTYQGGGSITVDAPKTQGQLRVLVKGWTGGKVGEDGKFIYDSAPVSHGGSVTFTDPGTTEYYTKEDASGPTLNGVKFSPAGGSFRTETQTVTATLESGSVAGWYQVEGKDRVNLTSGNVSTFTIGDGMDYGQTVNVKWSANDADGNVAEGNVTYKKIDPNAAITIYVKAPNGGNIYVWGTNSSGVEEKPAGAWPGKVINTLDKDGDFYSFTVADIESVNVIFNNGGAQTGDITGITEDVYYEYDGGSTAEKVDNVVTVPQASVTLSPNGGVFTEDEITVTATAKNAVSSWYKIGDGAEQNFSNTAQFKIGEGMENGDQVTVSWSATNSEGTVKTGSATFTKKVSMGGDDPIEPTGNFVVYYDNSKTNWGSVKIHYFGCETPTTWPGVEMEKADCGCYYYALPEGTTGVVFNNGNGAQTRDITPKHNQMYDNDGEKAHGHNGDDPIPPIPVDPSDDFVIYFDNSVANFGKVMAHYWGGASASTWPGVEMRKLDCGHYSLSLPANTTGLVVNNNDQGDQTVDITPLHGNLYLATNDKDGNKRKVTSSVHTCIDTGVSNIFSDEDAPAELYNLQGVRVTNPGPGIYIVVKGKKTNKIVIR